jgi:hypothetical protein
MKGRDIGLDIELKVWVLELLVILNKLGNYVMLKFNEK